MIKLGMQSMKNDSILRFAKLQNILQSNKKNRKRNGKIVQYYNINIQIIS